jgi:tetratricopeptide (TPR) repeat protein
VYREALGIFRLGGPDAERRENGQGEAETLRALGEIYTEQGRWEEAIQTYEEALRVFREIGASHDEGAVLANMGVLYDDRGQKEKAVAYWQEALSKLHPNSPEYKQVAEWIQTSD